MMKPILFGAALAASLLAAPATIGAQQPYTWPAYDIAYYTYYSHNPQVEDQVGQSRGGCGPYGPESYMEWGYETLHQVKVKVADCPVSL